MSNKSKHNIKKKINKLIDQIPLDSLESMGISISKDSVDYSNKTYKNLRKYIQIKGCEIYLNKFINDFSSLFEKDLELDFYSDEMIVITKLKLLNSIFNLGINPKFTHELSDSRKIELSKMRNEFVKDQSKCLDEHDDIKYMEVV
jgi:hypothetical protein